MEKSLKMLEKDRDIKLVATVTRRGYLVSQTNYHATKLKQKNSNTHERTSLFTTANTRTE